MDTLWTFGHGTLDAELLVALLGRARIEAVADIRRYPGSRRFPHLAYERMAEWLPAAGIEDEWIVELGGRRRVDRGSRHVGLRNDQFRAYADHMETDEFARGLERLDEWARGRRTAVMCSESVFWRCHRRLVADHLVLVCGVDVRHLFHDGRTVPHPVTPGATVVDGAVVYLPEEAAEVGG